MATDDRLVNDYDGLTALLNDMMPAFQDAWTPKADHKVDALCMQIKATFRDAGNPKLFQCTKESVERAAVTTMEIGLAIDTKRAHAFFIPRFGKNALGKGEGAQECCYEHGWRGLVHLARKSGLVTNIEAHIAYDREGWVHRQGLDPILEHTPILDRDKRGNPFAVYAIARMTHGRDLPEVMSWADVMDIKKGATSGGGWSAWIEHEAEMARKTAIRRICKYGPDEMLPEASYRALQEEDDRIYGTSTESMMAETHGTAEVLKQRMADVAAEGAAGGADEGTTTPPADPEVDPPHAEPESQAEPEPEPEPEAPATPKPAPSGNAAPDFSKCNTSTLKVMAEGAKKIIKEARSFGAPDDDREIVDATRKLHAVEAELAKRQE
jgi:recombination protein RecT